MRLFRHILNYLMMAAAAVIVLVLGCYFAVKINARGKTSAAAACLQPAEYALVLGTTPQNRFDGGLNYFYVYRMDAAEALWKAGKVQRIIVSGDGCSLDYVNEPLSMRDSLVARGVPSDAIIMDDKGFSTIESIERAVTEFNANDFIIVSQKFHNERAIYLAEHLRFDSESNSESPYLSLNVQALNARSPRSKRAMITYAREFLARVKMMKDILL